MIFCFQILVINLLILACVTALLQVTSGTLPAKNAKYSFTVAVMEIWIDFLILNLVHSIVVSNIGPGLAVGNYCWTVQQYFYKYVICELYSVLQFI